MKTVALILAGAGAQGAYEAGVLDVLSGADLNVVRIVGSSAGALNGTAFAAACRAGRKRDGASEIVDVWRNDADFGDVFRLRPRDWLPFRGLSDESKVLSLLRDRVKPRPPVAAINLKLIVTSLDGAPARIGPAPGEPPLGGCVGDEGGFDATTHERVCDFADRDFDTDGAIARVFDAAVASAAIPAAFAPYTLADAGACLDGGVTNNTPIGHALDGDLGVKIDSVIVVAPTVELRPPGGATAGLALLSRVIDTLVNERLFRDLQEAEARNVALRALAQLVADGALTADQLVRVQAALGWQDAHVVEIVRIRPLEPLPGDVFSGFRHPEQREAMIEIGRTRAKAVLDVWCR